MNSKSRSQNVESVPKKVVSNGLTSASASTITSQSSKGLLRQRTEVRASSAKYYDIASTILGGSSDVAELFLNSAKNGNWKKLEQLLQQSSEIGLNINCADKRTGNTALIWASKRGHSKVVELLLRYGADATVCNYEGQSALETAFPSVRTIILDWVETQEELNERLLLQTSWQGNLSIVRKILQNKSNIDVNCQNAEGLTPLMLVCRDIRLFDRLSSQLNRHYSPVQVAEELMKGNADILVTDSDGRSCLHYAAQSPAASAERLTVALVAGGFDTELCDKHLLTPLHLASQSGNTSNVVALADKGSDVNAKGFAGLTPLHLTAFKDHHITTHTLLKYGADVTMTDDRGLTPLDVAKTRRMKNTLKEAWIAATKISSPPQDTTSIKKMANVDEVAKKSEPSQKKSASVTSNEVIANTAKTPLPSQTAKSSQSKVLTNVDKSKKVERKILQEVEAFKATHSVLQRETTRMLGTPRTKVLPQIARSSSPEHSIRISQGNMNSQSSLTRGTEQLHRSLEETRNKPTSRGRSIVDIIQGLGRSREISDTPCVSEEDTFKEDQPSRLSRTSAALRDLFNTDKSSHHRSDSDPSAPRLRDLAASCDSMLSSTSGKRVVRHKPPDLILSRDLSTCHVNKQNEFNYSEKGSPYLEDYILQSMESPTEILRSHTILKDEFILEESRPKETSSGSDPASSISSCSQSSSSPRDLPFLQQPSPSRSLRHDTSLSTLLEQHASTHFSISDSLDGKPLILKPHKKLQRRSDNSLTSSIDSDVDDQRKDKVITRSNSLKKSSDRSSNILQESANLSRPLPVFKSQSMESISHRVQAESLADWLASSSVAAKSISEGNLELAQKDSNQTVKPELCQAVIDKSLTQTKSSQAAAKYIKPSKKLIIEPFIGKTKTSSITKVDSWKCSSPETFIGKKVGCKKTVASQIHISQKTSQTSCDNADLGGKNLNVICPTSSCETLLDREQESNIQLQQKAHSERDARNVVVSANNSVGTVAVADTIQSMHTFKPSPLSVQKCGSQEKDKILVICHQPDSTTQSSLVTNNIVHSSTTILKSAPPKPSNSNMSHGPTVTRQSHAVDTIQEDLERNIVLSEESIKPVNTSKHKFVKRDSLEQPKVIEADGVKVVVKQPCGTVRDNSKMASDKALLLKFQNKPPRPSFDGTKSTPIVNTSDAKNGSVTTTTVTNISSKSVTCQMSQITSIKKEEESRPDHAMLKPNLKDQESNRVTFNTLTRFTSSKPNIQLKTMAIEPLTAPKFHSAVAKPIVDVITTEMNSNMISTPVIVNPFEEFDQAHIKVIENFTNDALIRVKNTHPNKIPSKNVKKATSARKKPSSVILRQTSAGKRQTTKGKDLKSEKESRLKSGRKSGKGQRNKKTEKNDETEINAEAVKNNTAVISGIGWQLSTSCIIKSSNIKASSDLHLDYSDSDFSLDLDELESESCIKVEALQNQPPQAFIEKNTENGLMFTELKSHQNSMFVTKQPGAKNDSSPLININMAEEITSSLVHTKKMLSVEGTPLSTSITAQEYSQSSNVKKEMLLNNLTPNSEIPVLSSNIEMNNKKSMSLYDEDCQDKTSEADNNKMKSSQELVNSHCDKNIMMEKTEGQAVVNYEYTPTGKIVRTQSLKEFPKYDKLKELKFSQMHGQSKVSDENDDIDDIVEEILSSTTSSVASTMRHMKTQGTCSRISGVHTITESDRSLLLKMSSSKFSSPFHAKMSTTSKLCPADAVDDLADEDLSTKTVSPASKLSSLTGAEDTGQQKAVSQVLPRHLSHTEAQNLICGAASVSTKLPQCVRTSLMEDSGPRTITVGRSSSTRECRRQQKDSKIGTKVTEEETQQLVKILSSFKHVDLQASPNCIDGLSGSAKHSSRNIRNALGCSDQNSVSQPVSRGASFRSKGRFQEMKDGARTSFSIELNDAPTSGFNTESTNCGLTREEESLLHCVTSVYPTPTIMVPEKESQRTPDACRASTADSECSVDDIKSDGGDDTIQWKKGNVLGRGAFGTVLCGLTSEGQLIAVKQIELTTMDTSKAEHEYEKIQEEVELLKTLEHVNIVSYLGTSLEDNIVSIFMQFIPGGSIANILARFGALEESVFRIYTKQILEGVKYLHSNDVIHRDIKGANVMLMPNGVIKLIDFGCAKRLCFNLSISQTELLKSMNGTPFWMAPEVVNESGHGKKSDIWSIGCTVFEMATRKPPWADMNPMAAIFAIGSSSRPVPTLGNKFSSDARDFVSQCMTRDQDTRPGASELQEHPFITRQTSTKPSRNDD